MNASTKTSIFTGLLSLALLSPATAAEFTGSLKGVTITDSQATNKPPIAAFTYTVSGETVAFNASASSDSDGSISEYKWDFGDGSYGTGAQVQHTYSAKINTAVTLSLLDNNSGVALTQQTIVFSEPINLAVNFQPSNVPIPDGFVVDSGTAFDATKGFGWVVLPGSSGTRDRDSSKSPDQSYDTLIHVAPSAKWEATVPNGQYKVTICVGDPVSPDVSNTVIVEDIPIISKAVLSISNMWYEKTEYITVADGNITVTFLGSSSLTKLCWLKISSL